MLGLSPSAAKLGGYLLICAGALGLWLVFRHVPPVPDLSWLLEGTSRWMGGERLYVDIREINPPLIFYELAALSAGTGTNSSVVAGIAVVTAISCLWVARHHGAVLGLGVLVSITVAALIEFGQREHLLLIFVVPYLLTRGGSAERALTGLWAFLGVALKPYFFPVVLFPAALEAIHDWRSLFTPEKLALAAASAVYAASTWLLYPPYFNEIIPQAQSSYTVSLQSPPVIMLAETLLVCATIFLASPKRRPLGLAALGALASYYLQGRYWSYHFIAAAGLTMILLFWERRLALWTALGFVQVYQGPYLRPPSAPIPEGVTRVAVLSAHPSAAYPGAPGCRVRNIFPYGSLGFLPGPWNVATDAKRPESERQKARAALMEERARLRRYIAQGNPQVIIADVRKRKTYFERPFDFVRFIGLPDGFHPVGRSGYFEIWARGPINPNLCRERF